MKKQFYILTALLCFTCILGTNRVSAQPTAAKSFKTYGEPAPTLEIAKWIKGEEIKEFEKGRVYVVEFWATWCIPCIAGMPHLSELARKYRKDVTVISVSVNERNGTGVADVEKFVANNSEKMDYSVAIEVPGKVGDVWMSAYGERGIPLSYVIDKMGRIAWVGPPSKLDEILPKVISGDWDITVAARNRTEFYRLSPIDAGNVVQTLNPYMGRNGNPDLALKKIDSILNVEPGLKYYQKLGHYTFYALSKTDQKKAVKYAREWLAANDYPGYSTITDALWKRTDLIPELCLLGVDCYQAQLDLYPWSMDFKATYTTMAALYEQAGDTAKAQEMLKKAEQAPSKEKPQKG